MKHARSDYNRIQDPKNKIGKDEPVFLIRAQDSVAPFAIRAWADYNDAMNGDPVISRMARDQAVEVEKWQKINGSKMSDL